MKKTLHGKLYLRSRKSVMVGRRNKRIKKFNQAVKVTRRYLRAFSSAWNDALLRIRVMFQEIADAFK